MKNRSLKIFDKLVMALMGLFPFFSGCDEPREMYGTPTADYLVKGRVTDLTTRAPLEHIRVVLHESSENAYGRSDTVYSDNLGAYAIEFSTFPMDVQSFGMIAEDVDGAANGGTYAPLETTATVLESDWDRTNAGNWKVGKATVVKDIKLTK